MAYASESFTDEEREVLSHYVTDLDGPVFALVNLPEVVKGALFARYSRSPKSLRRLFLDEFAQQVQTGEAAASGGTAGVGVDRAAVVPEGLQRIRRRLGRATRRRPSRVRGRLEHSD